MRVDSRFPYRPATFAATSADLLFGEPPAFTFDANRKVKTRRRSRRTSPTRTRRSPPPQVGLTPPPTPRPAVPAARTGTTSGRPNCCDGTRTATGGAGSGGGGGAHHSPVLRAAEAGVRLANGNLSWPNQLWSQSGCKAVRLLFDFDPADGLKEPETLAFFNNILAPGATLDVTVDSIMLQAARRVSTKTRRHGRPGRVHAKQPGATALPRRRRAVPGGVQCLHRRQRCRLRGAPGGSTAPGYRCSGARTSR